MIVPTEAQEQTALFQWASMMEGRIPELRLMHHVANGGTRNPIEAVHLKQQGVKAGIPDVFLPVARGRFHGLYIEMKRRKGGRVSLEQRAMIEALRGQGYRCEVCKGWEEARNTITEYMKEGKDK